MNRNDLQLEDDWSYLNFNEEPYRELFYIFLRYGYGGFNSLKTMRQDFVKFYLTYKKYPIDRIKTLINL